MGYIKITVQSPKNPKTEIRNHNPPFIFISKKRRKKQLRIKNHKSD
jgi:hypothetical protein